MPPESAADSLALLVKLTLNGELLKTVQKAKDDKRGGANAPKPNEQALKEAVAGALAQPNLDFAVYREAVADYCDRVVAGVDSWDTDDQQKWKDVCNEVTDVISSVI